MDKFKIRYLKSQKDDSRDESSDQLSQSLKCPQWTSKSKIVLITSGVLISVVLFATLIVLLHSKGRSTGSIKNNTDAEAISKYLNASDEKISIPDERGKKLFECYDYTDEDISRADEWSLTEPEACESAGEGFVYSFSTWDNRDNPPGCCDCQCCKPLNSTSGIWDPTLTLTNSKEEKQLHYVDNGCQSDPWVLEGEYHWRMEGTYRNDSYKAFVRCCSNDGETCEAFSDCRDHNFTSTYNDAISQCSSIGKRLCTKEELWNERIEISNLKSSTHWDCCAAGTQCNNHAVWTSDTISVVESEGSCFNIANGCREELGGRAKWTGYQGENKESCLESCMQIPEALGCEFRKGGNGYDCKAFSIPVSNQSSDFRLYDFEDISEFTCWSINRNSTSTKVPAFPNYVFRKSNATGSESGRCCFRINHYGPDYSDKYGSKMVISPCCLEMISCEDYDKVFEGKEDGAIVGIGGGNIDMLEGTIGDHENCPKDALEAYRLIRNKISERMRIRCSNHPNESVDCGDGCNRCYCGDPILQTRMGCSPRRTSQDWPSFFGF